MNNASHLNENNKDLINESITTSRLIPQIDNDNKINSKNEKSIIKSKGKTKKQTPRRNSTYKTDEYIPQHASFGWKGLGYCKIQYDTNRNEYIYKIREPVLNKNDLELKNKLIYLFRIQTDVDVSHMTTDEKKEHLSEILEHIILTHKLKIDEKVKNNVFYYIFQEFLGYGKIDLLMQDTEIEDISCDGPNVPIFIFHRKFESLRTNVIFDNSEELDDFVFKLTQICGKQLSIFEPIVDGRLPDGSRLQATLGKTVTKGSTFTIRRFNENPLSPIDLIASNTLSTKMAAYFWFVMEHGVSILFCGGTASGKTTLLNALSLFIPPSYKIVSAEDTREINIPHENWIAGTTRQGFISSEQSKTSHEIDMFDLVKAALRQRPRVIIVGEVRGREANTMFQAMATGHLSYSTMHANDMQTLVQRLENHPINLPRALMVALDIVVFVKTVHTLEGTVARRLNDVIEILKLDPETNRLITVSTFSWTTALTDTFNHNPNSKILSDIMDLRGWSKETLLNELTSRERVLEWMKQQDIRSYKEVGNIIAQYSKNSTVLLNKIEKEML